MSSTLFNVVSFFLVKHLAPVTPWYTTDYRDHCPSTTHQTHLDQHHVQSTASGAISAPRRVPSQLQDLAILPRLFLLRNWGKSGAADSFIQFLVYVCSRGVQFHTPITISFLSQMRQAQSYLISSEPCSRICSRSRLGDKYVRIKFKEQWKCERLSESESDNDPLSPTRDYICLCV